MLHLRLVVPRDCWEEVVDRLGEHPGVVHLATDAGTSTKPDGLVVLCDVVREAGNDVIEWLQDRDIHRRGAITLVGVDTAISDAAAAAEAEKIAAFLERPLDIAAMLAVVEPGLHRQRK